MFIYCSALYRFGSKNYCIDPTRVRVKNLFIKHVDLHFASTIRDRLGTFFEEQRR